MCGNKLEKTKYRSTTAGGGAALAHGTGLKIETQALAATQHSSVWSRQIDAEPSKDTAPLHRALKVSKVICTKA